MLHISLMTLAGLGQDVLPAIRQGGGLHRHPLLRGQDVPGAWPLVEGSSATPCKLGFTRLCPLLYLSPFSLHAVFPFPPSLPPHAGRQRLRDRHAPRGEGAHHHGAGRHGGAVQGPVPGVVRGGLKATLKPAAASDVLCAELAIPPDPIFGLLCMLLCAATHMNPIFKFNLVCVAIAHALAPVARSVHVACCDSVK